MILARKNLTTQTIPNYFNAKEIEQFKQGRHFGLYRKFGAHAKEIAKEKGIYFTVWAPHANEVAVFGDFNGWKKGDIFLNKRQDQSGIWEGFVPHVHQGDRYKYRIYPRSFRWARDKADPYAFAAQIPPETASCVWPLRYRWQDTAWLKKRKKANHLKSGISIYEIHLGSWKMKENGSSRFMTYREMAEEMVPYVREMGFTHVEFLPIMEHPFYGSWGYQTLGYFTPSARYGTPQDFMHLIDVCHQNGIGVFLDWVPSHFPNDRHGLVRFDGSRLFETKEMHPDWQSCIFNLGSLQVKDFLISNALFWLEKFHVDGLRVDAVASMLYLDYSRGTNWKPNFFGGVENLEAIAFLRQLNQVIRDKYPDVRIIAEESTIWRNVSRPVEKGGLHFDMKWNLGWMHDTLSFFGRPVKERGGCLGQLTHCLNYAFSENFLLTLSHDEVVHMKNSLIGKMPGKEDEKFRHLRCLYAWMYAHPGKKLLFMGSELAQWREWSHERSLDWYLLKKKNHRGIQRLIRRLNQLYIKEKALHQSDFTQDKFRWLDKSNTKEGVLSFLRAAHAQKEQILVVFNYKKRYLKKFTIGLPEAGSFKEILNSDEEVFGGAGRLNPGTLKTKRKKNNGFLFTLTLNVPPLSILYLKRTSHA